MGPVPRANARRSLSLRGPSHGLQGTAASQRRVSKGVPTRTLRHSALQRLQRQGSAAVTATQLENTPLVLVEEEFATPGFDMLVNEHDLPEDRAPLAEDNTPFLELDGNESDWEEDDGDEGLAKTKERMKKQMRARRKDFRTRRDRTDNTWRRFSHQLGEMIVAYMDWEYMERTEHEQVRKPVEVLEIDVVDIFGVLFLWLLLRRLMLFRLLYSKGFGAQWAYLRLL